MPRKAKTSLVESRAPSAPLSTNGNVPEGKLVASADTRGFIDITNRDRMLFQLWGELKPDQLAGILKQAIIGNLVWQERLFQKMVDEWPRLQKNILSLKRDVANLDWSIEPFSGRGVDASGLAQEKADLVERALFNMEGDPKKEQSDFSGMIKDLVDAVPCCLSISEIYWTQRDGEIVPQCTRKIPARFYGYGLAPDKPDELMLNPLGNLAFTWEALQPFPDNKFLVGIFKGYNNHPTLAAMLRSLTPHWFAAKYGLKWFMTFCQMFGSPTRMAEYTPGDISTFNSLCTMLEQMGYANWGVFPAGAKVSLLEAKGTAGTMLPQRVLAADADEQCDIMILGQTLTSAVRSSGGNRALGQVHADTERKVLNGVADFVKSVINNQLIPAILFLNYGEASERPQLQGTLEEPTDELALAQRDQVLFQQMQVPVAKDFLYPRHSIPEPGDEDDLYTPPGIGSDAKFKDASLGGGGGGGMPGDGQPESAEGGTAVASEATVQPPKHVVASIKRGLKLRENHGHGGSIMAVMRARDIAESKALSLNSVRLMRMYFDAHPEDAQASPESAGGIAYLLHGGTAGQNWCEAIECKG
jgi:phage gp29-like protein